MSTLWICDLLCPPCIADADIIFSFCGFFFLLSFFLAYSQPSHIGCLPYFHTMCGLSANLECRSEVSCTRLTEKYRMQNIAKNLPPGHHCTTLLGCIFATKACIDNRKENLLNSNVSCTCPHNMANFSPLTAESFDQFLGTLANFNGFRVLALLLQRRHSPEANHTLRDI